MADLPAPLTPPDCDLRGMPFMPLDVVRLLDSDLFALSTGEEFKAAVALWCKSWSQNPAGSLPNDDRVLAHLSSANARWKKIKEGAMRGWVMCSDNRWYHPVVAEKALEALPMRQQYEDKKAANAARKERERQDRKDLFALLRDNGVVPEYDTPTKQLRELAKPFLAQEDTDAVTKKSQPVTRDMSRGVTAKTETETVKGKGKYLKPSDPGGSGAAAPKSPEEMTKEELWAVGKSLLVSAGMPEKQCGSYVGKIVKDYGVEIAIEAVRIAVVERPVDPASFLKATCQRLKGEKSAAGVSRTAWWSTDETIIAKGEELNMRPLAGESMATFKARIQAAIDNNGAPVQPRLSRVVTPPNLPKGKMPDGLDLKSLVKGVPS